MHQQSETLQGALQTTTVRGLQTAWVERGPVGQPIVFFCHGFPDDPAVWNAQIESLREDYHIIAPYIRGCEHSEHSQDLRRYGSQAILLDHLEILRKAASERTPVVVVGHDLGVVHAMTLARSLGPRLAGLLVINGTDIGMFAQRLKDIDQAKRSWYMGLMQLPLVPEALVRWLPESCAWLASELGHLPPQLRDSRHFERRTLGPLNQYRAFAREVPAQTKAMPARIKAPILVLWGRDDQLLVPPDRCEWERVGLDVTIRIVEGGHWLQREKPELVSDLLQNFIRYTLDKQVSDERHS